MLQVYLVQFEVCQSVKGFILREGLFVYQDMAKCPLNNFTQKL